MQTARVIGTATSTIRHSSLDGWRLLLLQPLDIQGHPEDAPILAIDQLGAGHDDLVFFTSDAKYTQQITNRRDTPVRFSVQGLVDETTD